MARNENQQERIAPYRPSIDSQFAELFSVEIPAEKRSPALVDWSFLDQDDGQPGEPADWVKRRMEMFADSPEIVEHLLSTHRWKRQIPPPSNPQRYDPDEPPFIPPAFD